MSIQQIDRGTAGNPNDRFKIGTALDTAQANDDYLDSVKATVIENVAALAFTPVVAGRIYYLKEYHAGTGVGGGVLLAKSGSPTVDNGITFNTGAAGVYVERINYIFLSPGMFGARCDLISSDSASFQKMLTYAAQNGKNIKLEANCYLASSVIFGSDTRIDLNSFYITGSGTGTNNLFVSGYLSGGVLISNVGTAPQTHQTFHSSIKNGVLKNCNIALLLQDTLDTCEFDFLYFENCTNNVIGEHIFYSGWERNFSRGSASSATSPAFDIAKNVNAIQIRSVSCTDRNVGYKFSQGIAALSLDGVNAESCTTGVLFENQCSGVSITNGYFEAISGSALDFSDATGKYGIDVSANYFNDCSVAIEGAQMFHGRISSSNYFTACDDNVIISDNNSYLTVEIPDTVDPDNITPYIPPKYTLGRGVRIYGRNILYNSGSGDLIASNNMQSGIVTFDYSGNAGSVKTGVVAYCTLSKTAGSTFDVIVDTKITYSDYTFVICKFTVSDNVGSYSIAALLAGSTLLSSSLSGKTMTASNNSGFLRITLSSFSHPAETYICTGSVRHV